MKIFENLKKWYNKDKFLKKDIIVACKDCKWCKTHDNGPRCNRPNGKTRESIDIYGGTITYYPDSNGYSCEYERTKECDGGCILCGLSGKFFEKK